MMTAKRFTLNSVMNFDYGILDNGESIGSLANICDLLNQLNDEKERLKQFKSKVFNLLQDEIRDESELLDYYLKEKAPCNADRQQIIIGVLKRLQKELEE